MGENLQAAGPIFVNRARLVHRFVHSRSSFSLFSFFDSAKFGYSNYFSFFIGAQKTAVSNKTEAMMAMEEAMEEATRV